MPNSNGGDALTQLLTHLSSVSGPDYKRNLDAYSQMYGLDVGGRYQGYNAARYLLPAAYGNLASQTGFYNSLQPMAQQSVNAMLAQLSNPDAAATQYRSNVTAQSHPVLHSVLQRLRSSGAGIGAQQGATLDVTNRATQAGNSFEADQNSPEGRARRLNALLSLIAGQRPDLEPLERLHRMTIDTTRNATGFEALAGLAGQIGSSWASGGFK